MNMVMLMVEVPAELMERLAVAAKDAGMPVGDYASLLLAGTQIDTEGIAEAAGTVS